MAPIADDEVIEHAHLDQPQGFLQAQGQIDICLAGLGNTGRMVVAKDQRCGISAPAHA